MDAAADCPVDNASPQADLPRRDVSRSRAIVVTVIAASAFLWLLAIFQMLFVVPRFEKTFAEFRMRVPYVTEIVIRHGTWFVPVCLLMAIAVCWMRRSNLMWVLLLVLLPFFLNLVVAGSYYFPYRALASAMGWWMPW